jgi:hypothetical protein
MWGIFIDTLDYGERMNLREKERLQKKLKCGTVMVTFTKIDGTERKMKCTLNEEYISPVQSTSTSKQRKENTEVCVVWDVEHGAWRSFRYDTIKEISL